MGEVGITGIKINLEEENMITGNFSLLEETVGIRNAGDNNLATGPRKFDLIDYNKSRIY